MKMFTAKEEKNLTYVLSKAEYQESALYLEELHGLLFGLAITPEAISPSKWLPLIFEEEPEFDDDQDIQTCIGYLMDTYNRMISDSNKGKLAFPFNYKKITDLDYDVIEGWAYGLFLALSLRPDIWGMSEEYEKMDKKDIPKDIMDLIDSCSIIAAIAQPEELEELFENEPGDTAKDPAEIEDALDELADSLYDMLPFAVETLQQHGAKIRKENTGLKLVKTKVGRNDACPCGSGKKYKKCCGNS